MTTLKRHRTAIIVGLVALAAFLWWRRRQAASVAQADTVDGSGVPYYVSSPVPGSGGFYDTGSDWTSSAPSSSGLGTTGGGSGSSGTITGINPDGPHGGGIPIGDIGGFIQRPPSGTGAGGTGGTSKDPRRTGPSIR